MPFIIVYFFVEIIACIYQFIYPSSLFYESNFFIIVFIMGEIIFIYSLSFVEKIQNIEENKNIIYGAT